jgi:hypothetical protein
MSEKRRAGTTGMKEAGMRHISVEIGCREYHCGECRFAWPAAAATAGSPGWRCRLFGLALAWRPEDGEPYRCQKCRENERPERELGGLAGKAGASL